MRWWCRLTRLIFKDLFRTATNTFILPDQRSFPCLHHFAVSRHLFLTHLPSDMYHSSSSFTPCALIYNTKLFQTDGVLFECVIWPLHSQAKFRTHHGFRCSKLQKVAKDGENVGSISTSALELELKLYIVAFKTSRILYRL